MSRKPSRTSVPKSMQTQLARLFGSGSREAKKTERTPAEWKSTLRKTLQEIERYVYTNVDSDELHHYVIATGVLAASESLKEKDFWPGYAEGITRVALALLGDYPDHRRRRSGAKSADHYRLDLHRSLHYTQDLEQRFRTLMAAGVFGVPGLSTPPRDVLTEFRSRYGSTPTHAQFISWYKKHLPGDYTTVFS